MQRCARLTIGKARVGARLEEHLHTLGGAAADREMEQAVAIAIHTLGQAHRRWVRVKLEEHAQALGVATLDGVADGSHALAVDDDEAKRSAERKQPPGDVDAAVSCRHVQWSAPLTIRLEVDAVLREVGFQRSVEHAAASWEKFEARV